MILHHQILTKTHAIISLCVKTVRIRLDPNKPEPECHKSALVLRDTLTKGYVHYYSLSLAFFGNLGRHLQEAAVHGLHLSFARSLAWMCVSVEYIYIYIYIYIIYIRAVKVSALIDAINVAAINALKYFNAINATLFTSGVRCPLTRNRRVPT